MQQWLNLSSDWSITMGFSLVQKYMVKKQDFDSNKWTNFSHNLDYHNKTKKYF